MWMILSLPLSMFLLSPLLLRLLLYLSAYVASTLPRNGLPLIVDMANAAMIKFDSDSDSDDDPLPYALYAGWEMVSSPLGS
nr:hypothetical protein [Tanacetum cinerariifolium]